MNSHRPRTYVGYSDSDVIRLDDARIRNARLDHRAGTFTRNIAQYIARYEYTGVGMYAMFAITDDGGWICHKCVHDNYKRIRQATPNDGWYVIDSGCACDLDFEDSDDSGFYCDHCNNDLIE